MKHLRLWSDLATEEQAFSKMWGCINPRKHKLNTSQSSDSQTTPSTSYLKNSQNILAKRAFFNWKVFTVLFNLTFPVQPTPFQIQKYTRIQAIARVIASGHRICPGFSRPSVIWCMLRLERANTTGLLAKNSGVKRGRATRLSSNMQGKEGGKCWAYSQNSTTALVMLVVLAKV